MRHRPIGVVILTGVAVVALVLACVHLLQGLGLVPYVIGRISIHDFSLWYVLMWALMIWVWAWVIRALWAMDPSAWLFLLIVSGFNLMFDFLTMISTPQATTDLTVSFLVNLAIFGYTLLPGTKRAFAAA